MSNIINYCIHTQLGIVLIYTKIFSLGFVLNFFGKISKPKVVLKLLLFCSYFLPNFNLKSYKIVLIKSVLIQHQKQVKVTLCQRGLRCRCPL